MTGIQGLERKGERGITRLRSSEWHPWQRYQEIFELRDKDSHETESLFSLFWSGRLGREDNRGLDTFG